MQSVDNSLERIQSGGDVVLEDEWLSHADEHPSDVRYFIEIARAAAPTVDEELLKSLLRLLDDELVARRAWSERLELLIEVGDLFQRPNTLHAAVLESVEHLYSDSDSLDEMLRIAGLHQVTQSPRRLGQQVERIHSLMSLDVGRLVQMEGKGVGRITEINFELGSYKIDFESHAALTVGFRAGAKLLEPVPQGHILRRKVEEPERLERLRDEDPSELLREVLESYAEPLSATEVRQALAGVVSSSQWAKWWNAARKHPQVVVTTEKRQRYRWAASTDDAARSVLEAFTAANLDQQLEIFGKNARQNPELAERMAERLRGEAAALLGDSPAKALEIWYVLSRAGLVDDGDPASPRRLVESIGDDLAGLIRRLSQRALRELVYQQIHDVRPDWPAILEGCLFEETEPALAARLGGWIHEENATDYARIVDRVIGRSAECPGAFVWVVEAARDDDEIRARSALRLFKQLLSAVSSDAFAAYRSSLEPQLESGGTLPKLIADLEEGEAAAALEAVKRAILPEYLHASLVNALETRFESLRSSSATDALYATHESIEARREELRQLRRDEIPAARQAVQEAAALGDLRENFEYKSARQRFEYLSARLATLEAELARVRAIDLERVDDTEVRIGARVELEHEGSRRELTVLGPWESAPERGIISYQSQLGAALLGKRPGDTIEIENGEHTVVAIRSTSG